MDFDLRMNSLSTGSLGGESLQSIYQSIYISVGNQALSVTYQFDNIVRLITFVQSILAALCLTHTGATQRKGSSTCKYAALMSYEKNM